MRVLAAPGHPNVIRLDQVLQDPEYLYIVMEFANGGDLFDILRCLHIPDPNLLRRATAEMAHSSLLSPQGWCADGGLDEALVSAAR